ncbi:MAG: SCO family protein, partial [Gammaproteobacteria bacterium]
VRLHDLELLNQDNERVKFASQVLGDKLVAVTFFYSTCATICPITNTIFTQLQSLLGERLNRDVQLVSVSVDPVTDTPQRLAAMAAKFQRKPGWSWLTGEKRDVDRVLEGLGAYSPEYTLHPVMVIVGDPRSGSWRRLFGFPKPQAIVAELDELEAARRRGRSSTEKEQ